MDFSDMVSEQELLKAIREDAEIQRGLDELANKIKDYWQSVAPKDTGEYAARIRIRKMRDEKRIPMRRIVNMDPAAHIIEYGSVDTPKFAVRQHVSEHFKDDTG